MKISIESTSKTVEINGVPARVWEGKSERGVPVICFVTRIAVDRGGDCAQFEAELTEHRPPSPAARTFDPRFFIDDND
jgi:hypothetical protein